MLNRNGQATVVAALLLGTFHPAQAQLWKNGSFDGFDALSSERNTIIPDSRVYDNFVVSGSGWVVSSIFGEFLTDGSYSTAYWEIRSGLSKGLGGSLLHAATSSIIGTTDLGTAFDWNHVSLEVGGFTPFVIGPGTYWLTIAPVGDGSGRAFVASTDGSNGINAVTDNKFFWDSQTFGVSFEDSVDGFQSDFAYGINGVTLDSTVPEPGSMLLLGSGLAVLGLAGWCRKRNK